jgi:hypothetical protein
MFDQLVKRSNSVWIYKTGRFAEERRAFLCDLSRGGRSLLTLRNVNKLLLVIAERVTYGNERRSRNSRSSGQPRTGSIRRVHQLQRPKRGTFK